MAIAKAKTKTMPKSQRGGSGRKTDPAIVEAAQMAVGGDILTVSGDENLTGKDRETSARSEAGRVQNYASKTLGVKLTTTWVASEQVVYIGRKDAQRAA